MQFVFHESRSLTRSSTCFLALALSTTTSFKIRGQSILDYDNKEFMISESKQISSRFLVFSSSPTFRSLSSARACSWLSWSFSFWRRSISSSRPAAVLDHQGNRTDTTKRLVI
jgi:hypothetical protein